MRIRALTLLLGLGLSTASASARAEESVPPQSVDPALDSARALYREGVEHVRNARWSEALSAFERSYAARPHATTTFNIGSVERALGRYTRARQAYVQALDENGRGVGELAPSLLEEAKGLLGEVEGVLARADVVVEPAGAALAVDGRPLGKPSAGETFVGGLRSPGPAEVVPGKLVVLLDPGAHVFTVRRKGYADVVVNRTFAPGERATVALKLDLLPATLKIRAKVSGALVEVNGKDFGPVPVDVLRPAGIYKVAVVSDGFEPYETNVSVKPGEALDLEAKLVPHTVPITKKWWFWASAIGVVGGGAVATYALTRPEPAPPPYEGGNTGWVVTP